MEVLEFFFCPMHGLLRPANWPVLFMAIVHLPSTLRSALVYVCNSAVVRHFDNLRRMGVL